MIYTISNEHFSITINSLGGEARTFTRLKDNRNFLWTGDSTFWGGINPTLFPSIGLYKDDKYIYEGTEYYGKKHGFARDSEFSLSKFSNESISLFIDSTDETKKIYPFDFRFYVEYKLVGNTLTTTYKVINKTKGPMYFSLGAHPAFNLEIESPDDIANYYLEFNKAEPKAYLVTTPYLNKEKISISDSNIFRLGKDVFNSNTYVMDNLIADEVKLKNDIDDSVVTVSYPGFSYFALWTNPDSPYICIEPWLGVCDSVDSNYQLTDKLGINKLEENEDFSLSYSIKID